MIPVVIVGVYVRFDPSEVLEDLKRIRVPRLTARIPGGRRGKVTPLWG